MIMLMFTVPPKITPFSFAADPHVGERASIQCVVVKVGEKQETQWKTLALEKNALIHTLILRDELYFLIGLKKGFETKITIF